MMPKRCFTLWISDGVIMRLVVYQQKVWYAVIARWFGCS
jgi:hypothetical protein